MNTRGFLILLGAALVVVGAMHARTVHELRASVEALRQAFAEAEARSAAGGDGAAGRPAPVAGRGDAVRGVEVRLARLEAGVAGLSRGAELLMERGTLPMASAQVEDLQRRFLDPGTGDRDRLQALRLLRRNDGLTDELLLQSLGWMRGMTNANLRQDVLEQLEGVSSAVLRAPLMAMASTDPDAGVREQAVENLGRLVAEPDVEAKLWDVLRSDPDPEVREQAQEALSEGPVSEARLAALRERALDPRSSIAEQVTALEAMREAEAPVPEVLAALVARAQATQDPIERARLFDAFDGFEDPVLAAPLVEGLRDPSPVVRESAADALSGFSADATVSEWLRYVAANDADPGVRREALEALERGGR